MLTRNLYLSFAGLSSKDPEIYWLIGHFAFLVLEMLFRRKLSAIEDKEFFGFLRFKYKEALAANILSGIAGLLLLM